MNAQERWKVWYHSSKVSHYNKAQCRHECRMLRREAALERRVQRLERDNARLTELLNMVNLNVWQSRL